MKKKKKRCKLSNVLVDEVIHKRFEPTMTHKKREKRKGRSYEEQLEALNKGEYDLLTQEFINQYVEIMYSPVLSFMEEFNDKIR